MQPLNYLAAQLGLRSESHATATKSGIHYLLELVLKSIDKFKFELTCG